VSNPGDRWRKSWIVGALGAALLGAVILGRCASTNSSSSTASFTAASVQPESARFAAELPAGAEVLVLRGTVTSKTATGLRVRAKDLATETPGLQIDDQLEISAQGIDLAEPEGILVALSKGLARPAALRINTESGAELTGVASTEENRSLAAKIVAASLGEGATVKNSVTVLPAEDQTALDTEAAPADTGPAAAAVPADTQAVVEPEPATTQPATTQSATTLPATTPPEVTVLPTTTLLAPTTTEAPTLEANGTIALEGVQFDLGSARLTPDSATVLDRLVKTLNDNSDLKIAIAGHTDSSGDPGFNRTLSKARANSVLAYLTKAGIDPSRLKAEGLGDSKPRADNASSAGRKQNRRIEVTAQE
jgi:outer membrane protein OmpA-like peptidoglycan-associated protein